MKPYTLFFYAIFLSITWGIFSGPFVYGAQEPIKIGFVGDFSSVSQAYTRNAFKVAQFVVSEFNTQGGLFGRPIEMVHRDGANDPDMHYRYVNELTSEENVVAVFGGASSACVLMASAASKIQKIPFLISIGNAQSIVVENGHPYVFMFEPNSRMESLGFSIFASLMPWQRYAWFGPDYIWGREVRGFFKQYFEEIGSPVTWTAEIWHPLGAKEYDASIQKVLASHPEALVVATWGEDLRYFIGQANRYRLFDRMAVFGWFSIFADETDRILPEGIWKISRGPFSYLSEKYPHTQAFVEQFKQQFDTYPMDYSICCYDSLIAWQTAAKKAGSVEPAAIAKALVGLHFTGLRGDSLIRPIDGQMNCPTYFGRLAYRSDFPGAVIESVIEIPAVKTWLTEQEVMIKRSQHRTDEP